MPVGCIQMPDKLIELTIVKSVEDMAENGLAIGTKVELAPVSPSFIDLKPVGHAPPRLVAKDGRVAMFSGCWFMVTTNDGRKCVGWIEWNLN